VSGRASISREELRELIDRGDPHFLFEVLPEPYYRRHHLPGALHMTPSDVEATIRREAPQQDAVIVLYCWDDH
jgi:rhodanese-related sulfurtransferase